MQQEFELTVRSTDVDMIGHVNHAKYLEYLEWARFEWLREIGLTMEEFHRREILPVVVHVSIDYMKELKFDEQIRIISDLARVGKKSSVIGQTIYNSAGELACQAEVTWVMIDAQKRKAIELPPEIKQMLQGI
ncbi:acyl-CoA thioester hydrolase/thioesterase-3 [Kroppenstedtia sanguinis]|uniref:Acyl-CoA thioesterase n=1 Tax=Kroppenstedtia sanguinis TaxID=1380684 RepID=A0ABW4C873_9BACL